MASKTTTNAHGYVVVRTIREEGKKAKTEEVSAPLLSEAAATEYAELCRKQGWEVSVVRT